MLDNCVVFFIEPDDEEFKRIMKNSRRKLEAPMPAAMPCRTRREEYRETCSVLHNRKTKHGSIVEAHESARKRMEGTLHNGHEDHTAGRGVISLNPLQSCAPTYSYASSNENTRCKSTSGLIMGQT